MNIPRVGDQDRFQEGQTFEKFSIFAYEFLAYFFLFVTAPFRAGNSNFFRSSLAGGLVWPLMLLPPPGVLRFSCREGWEISMNWRSARACISRCFVGSGSSASFLLFLPLLLIILGSGLAALFLLIFRVFSPSCSMFLVV